MFTELLEAVEEMDKMPFRIALAQIHACTRDGVIHLNELPQFQQRWPIRDGLKSQE